jgi:hypothetical protein
MNASTRYVSVAENVTPVQNQRASFSHVTAPEHLNLRSGLLRNTTCHYRVAFVGNVLV